MNFIKKWLISRELRKARSPNNDLDLLILEELKEAKKNNTMREKLLKLKMVQQIKNDQLEEMRQDIEGSDEEPEAAGGMEEQITQMIIGKLLGGGAAPAGAPQETEGLGPAGIVGLEEKALASGISPDQIEVAKKEFFK